MPVSAFFLALHAAAPMLLDLVRAAAHAHACFPGLRGIHHPHIHGNANASFSMCFPRPACMHAGRPTTASHHSGAQSTGAIAISHPRSLWSGDDGVAVSYRSTHGLRLRAWLHARPADHSQIHASTSHSPSTRCPKNRSLPHGIEGSISPRPMHAESVHII